MQQIGLSIDKYVPDVTALSSQRWENAVDWSALQQFSQYWQEHMFVPLQQKACRSNDCADGDLRHPAPSACDWRSTYMRHVAAGVLLAAVLAMVVCQWRRH